MKYDDSVDGSKETANFFWSSEFLSVQLSSTVLSPCHHSNSSWGWKGCDLTGSDLAVASCCHGYKGDQRSKLACCGVRACACVCVSVCACVYVSQFQVLSAGRTSD